MPDFLTVPLTEGLAIAPLEVMTRLVLALALGGVVAWIYRRTRGVDGFSATFPPTLVLLAVLIAMVTQVIGDNVARAFSLVGALSIVRFRTVVRDTQDTAYVIFAVVVGMAVGAHDPWVAVIGIGVVSAAAFLMRARSGGAQGPVPLDTSFRLKLRIATGQELNGAIGAAIDQAAANRRLVSVSTAKQGTSLNVTYDIRFQPGAAPEHLVRALNRIEGVQDVDIVARDDGEGLA